jgi:hypothetical protein
MEIPSVPRMGNDGILAGGPFVEPPDGAEELGNMARRRVAMVHWTLAKPIDFYKALQNYVYFIYIYIRYMFPFFQVFRHAQRIHELKTNEAFRQRINVKLQAFSAYFRSQRGHGANHQSLQKWSTSEMTPQCQLS